MTGGHLSRFDRTFNNNWAAVTLPSPDVIMFTLTDIILLSLLCPEKTCRPVTYLTVSLASKKSSSSSLLEYDTVGIDSFSLRGDFADLRLTFIDRRTMSLPMFVSDWLDPAGGTLGKLVNPHSGKSYRIFHL